MAGGVPVSADLFLSCNSCMVDSQHLEHPDQTTKVQSVANPQLLHSSDPIYVGEDFRHDLVFPCCVKSNNLFPSFPSDGEVLHRARLNMGQCRAVPHFPA